MVRGIQRGDAAAVENLHSLITRGVSCLLSAALGAQDAKDKAHEVFLIVLEAVRNGSIRDAERLPGYVRTVAQRIAATVTRDR